MKGKPGGIGGKKPMGKGGRNEGKGKEEGRTSPRDGKGVGRKEEEGRQEDIPRGWRKGWTDGEWGR